MVQFFKRNTLSLALGVLATAAIVSPASAMDVDQKEGFDKLAAAYLGPSVIWLQANPEYTEGGEAPKYWMTSYKRGPAESVIADINMVSGSDACTMLAHFVYFFDAKGDVIRRAAMLGTGMFQVGSIEYTKAGEYVSIIEMETPGGKLNMKDIETLPDTDTRAASAYFLNADSGEWDFRDTHYWKRAGAGFVNPCK